VSPEEYGPSTKSTPAVASPHAAVIGPSIDPSIRPFVIGAMLASKLPSSTVMI
jgi:hypothetical protein